MKSSLNKSSFAECYKSYSYIKSWLMRFWELNQGPSYEFITDEISNCFIDAFLMLPSVDMVKHSLLGAFIIDCEFSKDLIG